MACYGDLLQGKKPAAPTALDFGDYAVWQDAQRKTPEYESHRAYWKQQLQDLEVAPLPDAWQAAATTEESTIQSMVLPRSPTDAIATVGAATPFDIFPRGAGGVWTIAADPPIPSRHHFGVSHEREGPVGNWRTLSAHS